MSPALGMVLVAAVLHAVWNLAAKRNNGDARLFVWAYMTGSAVLALPIAVVLFATGTVHWSWQLLVAPLGSALIHIAYSVLLQVGYRRADLSVVYPVARGVGPLVTIVVAIAVLRERPGTAAIIGALLVLAGITIVSTVRSGSSTHPASSGLAYGAAVGATIAAYTLWDNHAVVAWHLDPIVYFAFAVTMQSILLSPGALARRPALKTLVNDNRREILTIAVLSPLAYVLVLYAQRSLPLTIVAPARESSIVIGSLLAWWLFREAHPVRRLMGAAVVLGGIALIAAG